MGGIDQMYGLLDKMGFLVIQNDGFELDRKVLVIADTSRKQDHTWSCCNQVYQLKVLCIMLIIIAWANWIVF